MQPLGLIAWTGRWTLCAWCEYKERCPLWATPETLERLAEEEAVAAEKKATAEAAERRAQEERDAQLDLL